MILQILRQLNSADEYDNLNPDKNQPGELMTLMNFCRLQIKKQSLQKRMKMKKRYLSCILQGVLQTEMNGDMIIQRNFLKRK